MPNCQRSFCRKTTLTKHMSRAHQHILPLIVKRSSMMSSEDSEMEDSLEDDEEDEEDDDQDGDYIDGPLKPSRSQPARRGKVYSGQRGVSSVGKSTGPVTPASSIHDFDPRDSKLGQGLGGYNGYVDTPNLIGSWFKNSWSHATPARVSDVYAPPTMHGNDYSLFCSPPQTGPEGSANEHQRLERPLDQLIPYSPSSMSRTISEMGTPSTMGIYATYLKSPNLNQLLPAWQPSQGIKRASHKLHTAMGMPAAADHQQDVLETRGNAGGPQPYMVDGLVTPRPSTGSSLVFGKELDRTTPRPNEQPEMQPRFAPLPMASPSEVAQSSTTDRQDQESADVPAPYHHE